MNQEKVYYDAQEAAEFLGVSESTFRRWAKKINLRTFYQFGHGKRLYYIVHDLRTLKEGKFEKGVQV